MENPYASPPPIDNASLLSSGQDGAGLGRRRGMVGHVRVLGILMIVQGALVLAVSLFLIGMGVFFAVMFQTMPPPRANQGGPPPEVMVWIMGGVYVAMGIAHALAGGLLCFAGWKTFKFRQRSVAIASLFAGLVTVLPCYCLPTAIGLLIYGLIVLLDGSVREAFELAQQGYTPDQIDALFNPYAQQPARYDPPLT